MSAAVVDMIRNKAWLRCNTSIERDQTR